MPTPIDPYISHILKPFPLSSLSSVTFDNNILLSFLYPLQPNQNTSINVNVPKYLFILPCSDGMPLYYRLKLWESNICWHRDYPRPLEFLHVPIRQLVPW